MKLLMLFVDGFEDTEALGTMDVLLRGGDEVTPVSLMPSNEVKPKFAPKIVFDKSINDINCKDFDGVVIPGGPGSFKIMPNLPIVEEIIKYFADNKKLVASICAAPHLVGRLGYFKNRDYTVHPGFETLIIGGNYCRECGVVKSDNFITAKSMYYSIEFGLAIHEYYHGKASRNSLEKSLQGE